VSERQRQAAAEPAEPGAVGETWIAVEQHIVERIGAAAGEHQGGAHREVAACHRPFVDAGTTLPAEHQHQHDREADRDQCREVRQEPGHQRGAGDQLGAAEQDHGGVEQPEVMQQKGDQVIGAEECTGHRTLELVCHPAGRVRIELLRVIDKAARASTQ
jgi:hypothetical protein